MPQDVRKWIKLGTNKERTGFCGQENMFLSFYLDGWSVPRRALGKYEVLTLPTASGRSDQSHRLAPMV